MNDFREFSKAYNDYLCHGQSTGSSVKYGSKEYVKSGRRVYGPEAARKKLLKDYADYLQEKELKHSVEDVLEKFGII